MNKTSKFFLLTNMLLTNAPLMAGDNPIENDGLLSQCNNPTQKLSIQMHNYLLIPSQIESETLTCLAGKIDAFSPGCVADIERAEEKNPILVTNNFWIQKRQILDALNVIKIKSQNFIHGESSWMQLMAFIDHLHAFKWQYAASLEYADLQSIGPNIVDVDRTIIATINIFEKNIEYTSRVFLRYAENRQAEINTFPEAIKSILLSIQEEVQRTVQSRILDQVDNHQVYQDRLGHIAWSLAKESKTIFKNSNKTLKEIIQLIDNIITSSV